MKLWWRFSKKQLSTKQAADVLGVKRQHVWRLANQGRLPYRDTPLGRLFVLKDVDRLRRQRARGSA